MSPLLFNAHTAFTRWEFSPFPVLMLVTAVAFASWYLQAVRRLRLEHDRSWSARRTVSFLAGLAAFDIALQSSVAALTANYFQAHVVQHLLLMLIAPPLLAMGAPMTLALQTSSRQTKVRLLSVLNSRPFKFLSHPLPVAFLYYCTMFAFFLTFAIGFSMEHMWVMDLVNLGFFFASTLFWWPIVGLDPIPHWAMSHGMRMTNLVIGVPIESFLALALLSATHPAAPMYTVASTRAGAAILWTGAEIFTFLALIPVFVQWLRFEERQTARLDAELDAELAAEEAAAASPAAASPAAAVGVGPGPVPLPGPPTYPSG